MTSVALGRRADVTAVLGALAAVTVLAWILTAQLAAGMAMPAEPMGMASGTMAMTSDALPMAGGHVLLVPAMWAAMMVGMMVPSATPMVLAYTSWTRRGPAEGRSARTTSFLSGYLIVWVGFSLLAALVQIGMQRLGLLTSMGAMAPMVGGAVLVLAGAFQLTPLKEACLSRCRTPVGFLISEWRDGARGALVIGVRHGAYCLGCCWALMAVLFVVGTMHLVWMAAIAAFVLVEKVAPAGLRIRFVSAAALVGWGVVTLATAGS